MLGEVDLRWWGTALIWRQLAETAAVSAELRCRAEAV